jgi:amino acid transporter
MALENRRKVGGQTLLALVIGNMLGAGVFTTSGFAMGDLASPLYVLLAWLIGGLVALCGAISYGALSQLMPVSGGEYLFLSRAVHPLAGFIAGWISLWAGFTAAIAFAAITLEAYLLPASLRAVAPENLVASCAILAAALAHGLHLRHGAALQRAAVALKLAFIAAFVLFVLLAPAAGEWEGVAAWRSGGDPPFSPALFATTLMWISFSYSGYNASIYIASEVDEAASRVPRAMIQGTAITTLVYLLLNAVFVLAPAPGAIAGQQEVAAIAARARGGEVLETAKRGIIALALFTSVSAMIMTGPRVYAQMADDGLMPAFLQFRGEVPARAIALQALLAVIVVWLAGLRELLSYLGFTLGLSSAATILSLFAAVRKLGDARPRLRGYPWAPLAAVFFTLLFAGLAASINPREMLAAALTVLSAVAVYLLFGRSHQRIRR